MTEIREITPADLDACAALLVDAYNGEPWNDHWTPETASRYLGEFMRAPRFQGFLLLEDGRAAGAVFGHGKTWWTSDEFFVDEFFISASFQRKGLGGKLLARVEEYVKSLGLAGITLLTDRHMPAVNFYLKNSFSRADHVIFMYKILR